MVTHLFDLLIKRMNVGLLQRTNETLQLFFQFLLFNSFCCVHGS